LPSPSPGPDDDLPDAPEYDDFSAPVSRETSVDIVTIEQPIAETTDDSNGPTLAIDPATGEIVTVTYGSPPRLLWPLYHNGPSFESANATNVPAVATILNDQQSMEGAIPIPANIIDDVTVVK
jgi:hypothetical protein